MLNWPFAPIRDLEFANVELSKDASYDKGSRLDLRVTTQDGEILDVEVQIASLRGYVERSLYYWAKLYEMQIKEGDPYHRLKPVICVNILVENNTDLIDSSPYHSYSVRSDCAPHERLSNRLGLHFIELGKFKSEWEDYNEFNNWLMFLKNPEEVFMHANHNEYIESALKKLEVLSHDPKMRAEYEARQKNLRDYHWELSIAKEDGMAEGEARGEAKGEAKGKREMIMAMLKNGMPIEQVVKFSEISLAEVLENQSQLSN